MRCCARVLVAFQAFGLLLAPTLGTARPFGERLEDLQSAADGYLAQSSASEAGQYPRDIRRVAWIFLSHDRLPDALLILKPDRSDCAANAALGRRRCKALILEGELGGGFHVISEFPLLAQPILLGSSAGRGYDKLYHSSGNGDAPMFETYGLRDGTFQIVGPSIDLKHARAEAQLEIDDRAMPDVRSQRYAADYFDNDKAMLAPFRLQIDTINAGDYIDAKLGDDSLGHHVDREAPLIAKGLAPLVAVLVSRIPWPVSVEARIWGCPDWVVPRRFWETEDRRLGKVGICADPLAFARMAHVATSDDDLLQAARLRLVQELGIAYVLRVAQLDVERKLALKAYDMASTLTWLGVVAGTLFAIELHLQSGPQMISAAKMWDMIAERWYEIFEQRMMSFSVQSPELTRYVDDQHMRQLAMLCVLQSVPGAISRSKGAVASGALCTPDMVASVAQMRAMVTATLIP